MANTTIEATYPIDFREELAATLGRHLKTRKSVVLIGMKRVGTNNFLRFFLNQQDITKTYIDDRTHLFIHVDLYDLSEIEYPLFWLLTLKRIKDAVSTLDLNNSIKEYFNKLFLDNSNIKESFLLLDSVRSALLKLVELDILPTIFFNRFDRIINIATVELFSNLRGLYEATHHKLCFVFTSFRPLERVVPEAFPPASLYAFCQNVFIKPASKVDAQTILDTEVNRSDFKLSSTIKEATLEISGGYFQYLQLALIILQEHPALIKDQDKLRDVIIQDERVNLQSEELWENLDTKEQTVILKVIRKETITEEEKKAAGYLWETGFLKEDNGQLRIFSELWGSYIKQKEHNYSASNNEFTGKEYLLFNFLKNNLNEICEREKIIEAVWPEEEEIGVSDWAIDRLVARARNKITQQGLQFRIETVKTRGFKLVTQ